MRYGIVHCIACVTDYNFWSKNYFETLGNYGQAPKKMYEIRLCFMASNHEGYWLKFSINVSYAKNQNRKKNISLFYMYNLYGMYR